MEKKDLKLPNPQVLKDGISLFFTESRKSAVGDNGAHLVIGLKKDDKEMDAKEVFPDLAGLAYSVGVQMAEEIAKENGFDGFRLEGNFGRLLTRDNFHLHFIFVKPGVEVRRSVDPMVTTA